MIMRWRNVAQALSESMAAPNGYVAGGSGNYIPPDGVLSPAETYVAPTVLPPTRSTLMQKVTALIQDSQAQASATPVVTPAAPVAISPIQQFLQKAVASIQNVQPQPVDTVAPVSTGQTLWDKVTTMITASAPEVVANVAPKISAPIAPALQPISAPALDYGVAYYNTPVTYPAPKTVVPTAVYTDPGLDSKVKPVIFQSTAVPNATYQDPLISSPAATELAKTEPLPATNKSGMVLLGIGALGLLLLLVKK
jgi:hypothetical protein